MESGKGVKRPSVSPHGRQVGSEARVGSGSRSKDSEPDAWFLTPNGSAKASVPVWMGGKEPLGGSVDTE